ncbi:MAG TPA: hypothetical protein VHY34_07570 [Caulobacteraceae bacterium]|jgi:hypothetical protein|nr:hypothetical protein [Caulobacteraceae bacterium]
MLFQVFLMPTTASPSHAQVQADVRAAIAGEGGGIEADGATLRTGDGANVKLESDGEVFLVDRLSPGLCRIVFKAAQRTNSTVDQVGYDVTPLKMNGSAGTPLGDARADLIVSPSALCVRLRRDLRSWNRLIREDQAEGVLGANEEPLEPPPGPGTETVLDADPSGVATHCKAMAEDDGRLGRKFVSVVVSQNPRWGVVWRADVVMAEYPDIPSRLMCWRRAGAPGPDKFSFLVRPLEMFDPAQSIGPLSLQQGASAAAVVPKPGPR